MDYTYCISGRQIPYESPMIRCYVHKSPQSLTYSRESIDDKLNWRMRFIVSYRAFSLP